MEPSLPLLPLTKKYFGLFFFRRRQPSKRRGKIQEAGKTEGKKNKKENAQ